MSKASRIIKLQEWRQEDFSESEPWRKRAMESYRFYTAIRQWDQADLDKLDAEGRPHLTIPLIAPVVNTLVGHQIDNEQQFKLYPRRNGSRAVAALGTELLKHTLDDCDGLDHFTEVFLDGLIGAVGVIEIEKQRLRDKINGELVVRKKSPFSILFDQNATEYDFNESGRRIFEEEWMTAEEIKLGFNKDIKSIQQATGSPKFNEEKMSLDDDYAESRRVPPERRDQYLVLKSYWREWVKNVYLVDLSTWSTRLLAGPKMIEFAKGAVEAHKGQVAELGMEPRLRIIERAGWMLYKTHFVGEMELLHVKDPWNGIMDFPLMPFYPYWADGYPMGVVDNLKDQQRELNKRVSQELHILNTTANAGWEVDEANDPEALKDLKEHGAQTGFVLDRSKFGGNVKKIEPNTLPVGHHLMAEMHEKYIDKSSGVDPNLRGAKMGDESGKAITARFAAGMTVSAIVHKNFRRTQKTVARFLWDVIRQRDENGESNVYSDKEIESIVQEANLQEFIRVDEMGQQVIDLSPFQQEDIGNYGIKVSTSPATPTIRAENLELLLRIAEVYAKLYGQPIIPPDFIIELTDIPRKEELMERLKQMQPVQQGAA